MKNLTATAVLFMGIITISCFTSCAKTDTSNDLPKEQQIIGKWEINRVQLRIYYSGVFTKDTIVPARPNPLNFTQFDASNGFQLCYNSAAVQTGTYAWSGDTIISTTSTNTYNWKMLTLTDKLLTTVSTSTSDPSFPGAKVETYYTFIR